MLAQHLGVCAHCQHMSLPAHEDVQGSWDLWGGGHELDEGLPGTYAAEHPGEWGVASCLKVPWAEMKVPPLVACWEDLVPFQGRICYLLVPATCVVPSLTLSIPSTTTHHPHVVCPGPVNIMGC